MLIRHVYGKPKQNYVEDIASLRLNVFKHLPYLYDGNIEDAHQYLERYSLSNNSLAQLVLDNDKVVGAYSSSIIQC